MRITGVTEFEYALLCGCGNDFQRARPQFAVECHHCGVVVDAAELVTDWVFENGPLLPRLEAPYLPLV